MGIFFKQLLIQTFDQLASKYRNKFTHDKIEKGKLLSLIKVWNIHSGTTILEVGSGTGDLSQIIIKKFPDIKLTCLDISPNMLKAAKQNIKASSNIKFILGDIEEINLKTKFDQIIIFNAFPHFLDKLKALKNCNKHLKKNGSLVICHNESRYSILSCHLNKSVHNNISNFPNDKKVYLMLNKAGFIIKTFENNEGYDYYLVIVQKPE
jgi:ubiquinone/menaquinone biosynthesis C-methylase UbiE